MPDSPSTSSLEDLAILRARARELAAEPPPEGAAAARLELVEFELGEELYGLELSFVRAAWALKELTVVPCTPPFIAGIINVRGEIQTVIDLRRFFDLPVHGITQLNRVILLEHRGLQMGILADAIRSMRTLALDTLQPPLPTHTGVRADYLRGLAPDGLAVLDALKILTDPRIVVNEEVPA